MPNTPPRRFYLTRPSQFEITYSINHWMDPSNAVDRPLAQQQWDALYQLYQAQGVAVEVLDPMPGWPDSVFTGDSIFLYGTQAIASRFRHAERAGEVEPQVARFAERGYTIHRLPEDVLFEGNGDAVYWNGRIFAGYGVRSDKQAHAHLERILNVEVLPIEVLAPHFHVDTVLCPLNATTLAYAPAAIGAASLERLRSLGVTLIEVAAEEAELLACNSIVLGDQVIMSTPHAPRLQAALHAAGFQTHALEMSEFTKSGGGVKCLTLEAYQPA
ncbi:MAG: hypothetical protein KF821_07845 [Anaerolineales bacterium]|nr:hypothetical protein [Anaerolineales bacterium]